MPANLAAWRGRATKVLIVRRDVFAKGRGRWLAVVVSLVVSGGMIYAQNAAPPCCAPEPSRPPSAQGEEPTAAPERVRLSEAELLAASAPVDGRVFDLALPAGVAPEGGLQVNTIWAARALSALFPINDGYAEIKRWRVGDAGSAGRVVPARRGVGQVSAIRRPRSERVGAVVLRRCIPHGVELLRGVRQHRPRLSCR